MLPLGYLFACAGEAADMQRYKGALLEHRDIMDSFHLNCQESHLDLIDFASCPMANSRHGSAGGPPISPTPTGTTVFTETSYDVEKACSKDNESK